jgi:molybdate transport repressor ModE-like protein
VTDIRESFRWAGVELRHLIALRAVADEGSVAAAARRLGYSQPGLSQQLATLERLLGSRLVERRPGIREATLTEAGQLVLRHGAALLARAQAADADLRDLQSGAGGTLRLGVFPSVGARIVPPLLQQLAERSPQLDVLLVEDASDRRLLEQIETAELDLAFTMLPLGEGPFAALQVLRDPYVVLLAAGSPIAERTRALGLRELGQIPLIGFRHSQAYPEAFLRAQGIDARIRFRIDDNETLVGLVAAGLGAALVPRLTVDSARKDVVQLEITAKLPPRLIAIAWHRDRKLAHAAADLVEIARELCGEV